MSDAPETLIAKGYQARRDKRLTDARRHFSDAVALSLEAPSAATNQAAALTGLAQIERDLHDNAAAIDHYQAAASLYRSLDDHLRYAHTVRHIADIHRGSGARAEAARGYTEALSIYREQEDTPALDLANTLRGYALLCEAAGDRELAMSLWREASGLYQSVDVQPGVREAQARLKQLAPQ